MISVDCTGLMDSAAIQTAIDFASPLGLNVMIPMGTWDIDQKIKLPDDMILYGSGPKTVLKAVAGYDGIMISNSDVVFGNSDISIQDMCIDGNIENQSSGLAIGIRLRKLRGGGVFNLHIKDCQDYGVHVSLGENVDIDYCDIVACRAAGIRIKGCVNCGVSDTVISGCDVQGLYIDGNTIIIDGVTIYEVATWQGIAIGNLEDSVIRNCHIDSMGSNGISSEAGFSMHNCVIYNNVIENCDDGVFVESYSTGIVVENNTINCTKGSGVVCRPGVYCSRVTGNSLGQLTNHGVTLDAGCHDCVVDKNGIIGSGKSGINMQAGKRNQIITNNVQNSGRDEVEYNTYGINIWSSVPEDYTENCIITGNICVDNQPEPTQTEGIRQAGPERNNIIANNIT